ncbi:ketopantoate reductase family protein [Bartonella tamiae]|uniref:2-dehydropantoate 2-reductase n=1 Tax=Bartonella tamiae Th239 TaxID=1094558 RepID=J0ZL24_9HYPH|nr:ketopantoate reductase family protein [Bartonella tamiae]EJF89098.1 2-dehydropantoate 2-reductase [Bartonella tamiae Th239]
MARILVLGAGAVGGYFGGRLAENGHDVTFLVRQNRQAQLERDGLLIESPSGQAKLKVRAMTQDQLKEFYDFVFLTPKAYDLDSAIESIRPACGADTVIFPILNGMAHMERLNAVFGRNQVMAGCVVIQATLGADGVVHHLNSDALGFFGAQDGGVDGRASSFANLFEGAKGLKVRAVDNAMQRMWDKWVRLATLAGMTCLMRANVGEITRVQGGEAQMMECLRCNNLVATAEGYPLDLEKIDETKTFLVNPHSKTTASMLRDIESGKPTEGDQILGDMVQRAVKYGLNHPILELAYTHVKAYEERRSTRENAGQSH